MAWKVLLGNKLMEWFADVKKVLNIFHSQPFPLLARTRSMPLMVAALPYSLSATQANCSVGDKTGQ